ncbi:PLP-dependent cysteine synthase family protein [Paracoccaceae bacterium GXU_MW_L88]
MPFETPIFRRGNVLVKMEAMQPGGSHKARAARYIVRQAMERGDLTPGGDVRILEKSGGNLGVGLAYEASRHGIGVDLVIGLSFSRIKRALCEQFGAKVICDDRLRKGATPKEVIAQLLDEKPEQWFFTDQFANQANLAAHLAETGPELVRQVEAAKTPGQPIILVKGAGTGASFQAIATRMREAFEDLSCEMVMPENCDLLKDTYGDHGLEGFAVGVRPPFLDLDLVDRIHVVPDSAARQGQRAMAREIGYFPGMTSGANFAAAQKVAQENPEALVVTLAYDSGESYLRPEPVEPPSAVELAHAD